MNRAGPDGKPMTCHRCKSVYHFLSQCDSKDGIVLQVAVAHEEGDVNENKERWENLAILDST